MKIKIQTLGIAALLPVAVMTFSACSSAPKSALKYESAGMTAVKPGEPGGVMVDTHTRSATVTGIDKATRKLTLVTKDGDKTTVKAGPAVANFDQIEVGDQIKVTEMEQLVVFARKPGEPSGDGKAAAIAMAPLGAKPGVLLANTEEITAKVKSIDVQGQKATLLFPDGTSKTFNVRKDVDLTKRAAGEEIIFRTTESIAISVEKP